MRNFELPGRSAVHATEAMAATSHPLATATALHILRRGGTAADAAIAGAAVLAVVEPAETGIGGDCFALVAPGGRLPPAGLNGSGRAPAAAEPGWYLERGFAALPDLGPHAVTVPGAVDAWCRLHERFGRLDLAELLGPAIRCARDGHVVHARVAREWQVDQARLTRDVEARAIFLPDGRSPATGSLVRNPALADTLAAVAAKGRAGFYEGEVAGRIVRHLRDLGGLHTLDDFAATAGELVEPIAAAYRGRTVYELPPNTQGGVALLMLRLLEGFGPEPRGLLSPERIHLGVEVARLAYGVRDALLGDAERSGGFLALLDSPEAIARLATRVRPGEAMRAPVTLDRANTVYLTVVDRDRNVVSLINSIYDSFGSGVCPPGTGVLLQSRGRSFRLDPAHPNAIGPRRRPMHTIIPGMAGRDGRAELAFGVMGGDFQPTGHAHVLSALWDHGLDPQAACDAPRYVPVQDRVEVECGIGEDTRATLARWGHHVVPAPHPLGGAQAIAIDWREGTLTGGSDPRKDGCALGY